MDYDPFASLSPIDRGELMELSKGNPVRVIIFAMIFFLFMVGLADGGSWVWQNPLPQGNSLYGVWGSSGSDVFAVGDAGTILHYDGSAWTPMSSGTTDSLRGVWGSSGRESVVPEDIGVQALPS